MQSYGFKKKKSYVKVWESGVNQTDELKLRFIWIINKNPFTENNHSCQLQSYNEVN